MQSDSNSNILAQSINIYSTELVRRLDSFRTRGTQSILYFGHILN